MATSKGGAIAHKSGGHARKSMKSVGKGHTGMKTKSKTGLVKSAGSPKARHTKVGKGTV